MMGEDERSLHGLAISRTTTRLTQLYHTPPDLRRGLYKKIDNLRMVPTLIMADFLAIVGNGTKANVEMGDEWAGSMGVM